MNWTAQKIDKAIRDGQIVVGVVYEDSDSGLTIDETYRSVRVGSDWPDSVIRARLVELMSMDLSLIELGSVKPTPVVLPPTQEELDLIEFLGLLNDYMRKQAEVKSGVGRSTQADVDDALAAWKAKYKDQYAPYIVGTF